jgi:hypothetical protein
VSHVKNFDDQKIPRKILSIRQVLPVFACVIEEKTVISGLEGELPVNRLSEKKFSIELF